LIYLALKAGLIIVSDNKADPNPYVLLVLCFMGTVFNEDVWEWARKFLNEFFSRSRATDNRTGDTKTGGSESKTGEKRTADPPPPSPEQSPP
jgi:hypothetical protein